MIRNDSFLRKVIYLAAMVPILAALAYLGLPATGELGDKKYNPGGKLARMRSANDLSQASLGKIDPAGETMKLATLGLRPVAAAILWQKFNDLKMKESWDAVTVTLNTISKLQPNYVGVWEFQAHNLSYNISVEFDDYRDRYRWVIKGLMFLLEGNRYNSREPKIPWNLGWFTGQKIGRADEKKQFRRLFREDYTKFFKTLGQYLDLDQALGPPELVPVPGDRTGRKESKQAPDNWKVSRLWYLKAIERSDQKQGRESDYYEDWRKSSTSISDRTEKRRSPLIFQADPAMSLVNYASTLQEEGKVQGGAVGGGIDQIAWENAYKAIIAFGDTPIRSSWGHSLRLNSSDKNSPEKQELESLKTRLDALAPGERQRLYEERLATLTDHQRSIIGLSDDKVRINDQRAWLEAQQRTAVSHTEVAELAPKDKLALARRLAARLVELEELLNHVMRYRQTVNYDYWVARCGAEKSYEALEAHYHLAKARELAKQGLYTRLSPTEPGAKDEYELVWDNWDIVFKKKEFASLLDSITTKDLLVPINEYRDLLERQLGEKFPTDFKLQALIDINDNKTRPPGAPASPKKEPAKPKPTDPVRPDSDKPDGDTPEAKKPEPEAKPAPEKLPPAESETAKEAD